MGDIIEHTVVFKYAKITPVYTHAMHKNNIFLLNKARTRNWHYAGNKKGPLFELLSFVIITTDFYIFLFEH